MGRIIANKNKLANKVLKLRKELKMTEIEFSKLTDIDIKILKNIEIGEYDGSISQLITKICEATNIDTLYFNGVLPLKKNIRKPKNEKDLVSERPLEPDINLSYTFEEISKFTHSGYIFYENLYHTYELKNAAKTRICAYCGKKVSIKHLNEDHIVFKCNCNDFLDNSNEIKELERKKRELIQAKLNCHYKDYIKENNLPDTDINKILYEKEAIILGVKMWSKIPK